VDVPPMSAFTPTLPAAAGSSPAAVGSLPAAPGAEGTLAALANRLGMSADGLHAALKQGQSIAGLAEQHEIPRESVGEFLGAQIQQARTLSGQPPLDENALGRMVDRALDRGRPAGGGAGGGAGDGESAGPAAAGVGAYASNARVSSSGLPAGSMISLLA
jgi:hypothetical protein